MLLHRQMKAAPEPFLQAMAPSREGRVVAGACLFPWDWLADLCAEQGRPFGLGHALSMQAMHGGKATKDPSDAQNIAVRLRGGRLPQASVSPAARRATRALLRRRPHLRRKRAALFAHVHKTNAPDNVPEIGTKIADKANREGVADRVPALAVQKTREGDLALLTYDDKLRSALDLSLLTTAKHHDAPPLSLWHTVPALGTILRLVRRDALHDLDRFPRGQDCASSGRRVTCAQASAGQRWGTSGQTIGHAHRTWAFAEAAALVLRSNEPGQQSRARLETKPDQGQALTIRAPT
jgi:hypothetical protein